MANEIAQLIGNSPTWSNQRAVTVEDLRAMKPFLQAQGKWNPAWDAALEDSAYYSSQQEGESGMLGSPASKQLDLSSLSGYQMAETRGPGRTGVAAYLDPQGGINGARAFERGGSMHRGDWATMGSVIGGVLGGGYALSGGLGGAAGGAAAGGGGAAEAGLIGGDLMAGYGSGAMGADMAAGLVAPGAAGSGASLAAPGAFGAGGGLVSGAGSTYMGATNTGTGAGAGDYGLTDAMAGDPTRAALYGDAGYGTGMAGAETAAYGGGALLPMGPEAGVGALDSVPAVSGTANGGGWLSSLEAALGSNTGRAIGSIGSAWLQSQATQRANQTQQAGTDAAIAEQRRQYDTTRTDQAPYREAGVNALRELVAGTNAVPSHETVMSDPGYQFAQQQGERGIRNQFAASGGRMSGAQMKAGIRFNQGNASTGYNAAYQRLQDILNRKASIAGLGQTSTQASSAAGQNATNAITGLIAGQSDATAAGQLARGNIWGNVGNNILAQYGRKTTPRTTYVDGYYEGTGG